MVKSAKNSVTKIVTVLVVVFLLAVGYSTFLSPVEELFSSDRSPNGQLVAKNFMVDGCSGSCATGLIVVEKRNGGSKTEIDLAEPDPSILFRWLDDTHLLILSPNFRTGDRPDTIRELKGVHVSLDPHPVISANEATARLAHENVHEILDADVAASFSKDIRRSGDVCRLMMAVDHQGRFKKLGIEIDAPSDQCVQGKQGLPNCASMSSRFWVAEPLATSQRLILTSADVSGADGYGVLPTGDDHMAVRGQFSGTSATRVAERLIDGQFSIDYNFEFSNLSLRYHFPAESIKRPGSLFLRCIGAKGLENVRPAAIH
ncbi:hypothetical protein AXG89_31010 (plasmid) [Burkholderia sp. PAMC 26561]|nr:hypothetical protein AXG89_31010 [Burkholderia sp. PAMC 26561]